MAESNIPSKQVNGQSDKGDSEPKTYCENCMTENCCGIRPPALDPEEDHYCSVHAKEVKEVDRYEAVDKQRGPQEEPASNELLGRLKNLLSADNIIDGEVKMIGDKELIHWTVPPAKIDKPEGQRQVLTAKMINELIDVYLAPKENDEDRLWSAMQGFQNWDQKTLGQFLKNSFKEKNLLTGGLERLPEIVEEQEVYGSILKEFTVDDLKEATGVSKLTFGQRKHYEKILAVANADRRPNRKPSAGEKGRYIHVNIGGVFDQDGKVPVDPWNKSQIQLDDNDNIKMVNTLESKVRNNPDTSLYLITSDVTPVYPNDRDIFDCWQGSLDKEHAAKRVNASAQQKAVNDRLLKMIDAQND